MPILIDVEGLDPRVFERLQTEARRRGVNLDVVIKEVLSQSVAPTVGTTEVGVHHDLDSLAGTWSDEEAKGFLAAQADFGRIDESLWK